MLDNAKGKWYMCMKGCFMIWPSLSFHSSLRFGRVLDALTWQGVCVCVCVAGGGGEEVEERETFSSGLNSITIAVMFFFL